MDVRLSTDGGVAASTETAKTLYLDQLTSRVYCVAGTSHACISTAANAISHTKLFVFSTATAPDGIVSTDVVWFGSANQTYASGMKLYNNTVTLYGDAELFTKLRAYLTELYDQNRRADYDDAASARGYLLTDGRSLECVSASGRWSPRRRDYSPRCAAPHRHAVGRVDHRSTLSQVGGGVRAQAHGVAISHRCECSEPGPRSKDDQDPRESSNTESPSGALATAVWGASYAGWIPAPGILPPPEDDRKDRQVTMVAAHWVFGAVLGYVVAARRR